MKFRVIDLETTDSVEAAQKGKAVGVCEVGFTDLHDDGRIERPVSLLVNPGIPMPPQARAVHHISDADLALAPSVDAGFKLLMTGMEPGDYFVAHNADFERHFFGGGSFPWICTLQCAKHIWDEDEVPGYSNQVLRYWLDVEAEIPSPEMTMPPHRAGPDSYVTAFILRRMLKQHSADELHEMTGRPVLQKRIKFSKHAGQLWSDLDPGFLQWVLDKDFDAQTKATARYWLNRGMRGPAF